MFAITELYGFLNKSHVLQINSLSKRASKNMSNMLLSLNSYCKIMMTNCSLKQPKETMTCIICFLVLSLLVITYEHSVMACLLIR